MSDFETTRKEVEDITAAFEQWAVSQDIKLDHLCCALATFLGRKIGSVARNPVTAYEGCQLHSNLILAEALKTTLNKRT